jgi:RNA polymerase sigma factor (TIGR02999 family)
MRSANASTPNSDAQPVAALYASAYGDLRRLARHRLAAGQRDTLLNTTALVHESYLRLAEKPDLNLENTFHFLSYAGRAMRSIIVDCFRRRIAERRGSAAAHISVDDDSMIAMAADELVICVHDALEELEKLDARMARIVEMRYFAGMTESEIARVLSITDRTVRREWEKARLWLSDALRSGSLPGN